MAPNDLISREEILGGLPAKRARTLLFLIENRTGLLVSRAKHAMDLFDTPEVSRERDLAFIEAFSTGREPPVPLAIQDLERFAHRWANLVPDNPRLRAALAHMLSQKYALTYGDVPRIRASLGLEQEAVKKAYHQLYKQPLESIYATHVRHQDRLRWSFSRLATWFESLSPFWTVFFLTLTETVGATILALPIALARIGPLGGIVLLIVLGLVNILTIGCMAEAISRSGTIRHGQAFIGRVLTDYLGGVASAVLSLALGLICFLVLQAYYIGFSITLADATHVPPTVWTAVLFFIGMYFVSRESLNMTVVSAFLIGAVNMALILFISALAFTHLRPEYIWGLNIPFLGGRGLDPSILELIFGVILAAYFGHLSISNCARVVLRRDPSARSLIWGSMAALAVAMVIYCIWVLAVNGAVSPASFEGLPGTALSPLAEKIGPIIHVLGAIFVTLGMGMSSVHFSLGLLNLMGERLPARKSPVVVLPRGKGQIVFHRRRRKAGPRIGLTYLGLKKSKARFLLEVQWSGRIHREEIFFAKTWNIDQIVERYEELSGEGINLALEILNVDPESVYLKCISSLAMAYEGDLEAVSKGMADILSLPNEERNLLHWMMRHNDITADQAAVGIRMPRNKTLEILKTLSGKGFVLEHQANGVSRYRVLMGRRRASTLPEHIWKALDETVGTSDTDTGDIKPHGALATVNYWVRELISSRHGRFVICISPIILAFLVTEWMLYTGKGSFAGLLSFLGVVVVPLLGGMFPVLMVVSSRRKGEYKPGIEPRLFGNRIVLTGVYLLFLLSLLAHGLFIWKATLPRIAVLLVAVLVLALTIWIVRRKVYLLRTVVEFQIDEEKPDEAAFRVISGGEPTPAKIYLEYPEGEKTMDSAGGKVERPSMLKSISVLIPTTGVSELKVLAQRITADADAKPIPGTVEVQTGTDTLHLNLKLTDTQLPLPIACDTCRVKISFGEKPDDWS